MVWPGQCPHPRTGWVTAQLGQSLHGQLGHRHHHGIGGCRAPGTARHAQASGIRAVPPPEREGHHHRQAYGVGPKDREEVPKAPHRRWFARRAGGRPARDGCSSGRGPAGQAGAPTGGLVGRSAPRLHREQGRQRTRPHRDPRPPRRAGHRLRWQPLGGQALGRPLEARAGAHRGGRRDPRAQRTRSAGPGGLRVRRQDRRSRLEKAPRRGSS